MSSDVLSDIQKNNPAVLSAGGRRTNRQEGGGEFAAAFTGLVKPKVAYIGTANGDSQPFYLMMKASMLASGASSVTKVRLATDKADVEKAKGTLSAADLIFLSGGEVEDGMAWLQKHGLVGFLRDLHKAGKRFVGVSAGTIMIGSHWVHWDVEGDDDTSSLFECLGISPLLFDVHGESEDWVELKAALKLLGDGALGYALPSGCSVYADDKGNLVNIDGAYMVFVNDNGAVKTLGE